MRRSTIGLLVTCACGLLWIPLMATAQLAEKVWRIGVLGAGVAPSAAERQQSSFWQAMREIGLVEGQNITVEILQAYQEQHSTVEPGFRWSKNPAAISPVWLEKPEWIAALAMLTVVRLLLYAVIQRQVRLYLRDHQPQVPGNKGPTATPTAAVLFALFASVMLVQCVQDNTTSLQGHGVQGYHLIICEAVGIDPAWYHGVATEHNALPRTTPP